MTLDAFEKDLIALIGKPTDLRPFICDGSPLDCAVFLAGLNPATSLDMDFWAFWSPDLGYDKANWFRHYLAERAAKPLKLGKMFRRAISPSRRNIEAFVGGAGNVRVLETNIYAKASDDLRSLDVSNRETAPFRFLVDAIRPKVIVVHGKSAVDAIAKFKVPSQVIAADHHFSRRTSRETARALGARAAALAV